MEVYLCYRRKIRFACLTIDWFHVTGILYAKRADALMHDSEPGADSAGLAGFLGTERIVPQRHGDHHERDAPERNAQVPTRQLKPPSPWQMSPSGGLAFSLAHLSCSPGSSEAVLEINLVPLRAVDFIAAGRSQNFKLQSSGITHGCSSASIAAQAPAV
jgi:hypothetical protein